MYHLKQDKNQNGHSTFPKAMLLVGGWAGSELRACPLDDLLPGLRRHLLPRSLYWSLPPEGTMAFSEHGEAEKKPKLSKWLEMNQTTLTSNLKFINI